MKMKRMLLIWIMVLGCAVSVISAQAVELPIILDEPTQEPSESEEPMPTEAPTQEPSESEESIPTEVPSQESEGNGESTQAFPIGLMVLGGVVCIGCVAAIVIRVMSSGRDEKK